MKTHMKNKHSTVVNVESVHKQAAVPTQKEKCPVLRKRDNYDDESEDDDDGSEDEEHPFQECHFEPLEDESDLLNLEYQESIEILANSFSSENLSLDHQNYPDFGNEISNTYYEQDYNLFHKKR